MTVHSFAIAFLVLFPLWGALREQAHGGEGVAGAYGFGILGAFLSLVIAFLSWPSGVLALHIFALPTALVLGLLGSALFGFTLQVGRLVARSLGRQPRYCQIAKKASRYVSVAAIATAVVGIALPAADLFGLKPNCRRPSKVLRSWFSSRPVAIAFDSKGQHLVSANRQDHGTDGMGRLIPRGQLTCYLLADGSVQAQTSLAKWLSAVAYSPKDEQVAFGTYDGQVGLWDLPTGQIAVLGKNEGPVGCLSYSPDGRWLVSAHDGVAVLWELSSRRRIQERRDVSPEALAWDPNGRFIAVIWLNVRLIDSETLKDVHIFEGHQETIRSVAFSRDGRNLVSGDGSGANPGQVIVWDVVKKVRRDEMSMAKSIRFVGFAGASNDVVTALYGDWRLQVWDETTKRPKTTCVGLALDVATAAISADGRWLAACDEWGKLAVWDLGAD